MNSLYNTLTEVIKGTDSNFLKNLSALSLSNGLSAAVKFILYIFIARILGPKLYGDWVVINTLISYVAFSHLGILNAMNREIPYNIGRKKVEEVDEIQSTSFSYLSLIIILLIVIGGIYAILTKSFVNFSISLLFASILGYRYFEFWLKSYQRFINLSKIQIIIISLLLIGIPLSNYLKLHGWILANILPYIAGIFTALVVFKIPVSITHFSKKRLFQLLNIGFPIMLVGVSYTLFITVERWVILKILGNEALGYYSLVTSAFSICVILPYIIADQYYPYISMDYGKNNCYERILKMAKNQIFKSVVVALGVNLVVFIILPTIVKIWLPKYIPGIVPLKIMLIFLVFLPIGYTWSSILNIINKQKVALVIQSIFILVKLLVVIPFALFTKSLEYITVGAGITIILYSIVLAYITLYHLKNQNVSK